MTIEQAGERVHRCLKTVVLEQLATLDVLSGGRVLLGVGVGWMAEEAAILGMPWDRRGRRTDEQLEIFQALFSEATPSYAGQHYQLPRVAFEPKPLQQPFPIWAGGSTRAAFERTARFGSAFHAAFEPLETVAEEWAEVRRLTEAAGPNVDINGSNLRNGTVPKSFTLQKHFSDVSEYVAFTGMRVASLNLTVDTGALITGAFSFQGKSASASGTSAGSGSPTAAPTHPVLNAIDNIEGLVVGDGSQAFSISSHNFTLDNTLRSQKAQGTLGSVGIGLGTLNVTGALTAYFENRSLYEQYLGFGTSSFAYRVIDAAGNAYIVTFPALKFTDGNPVAGGRDQDILAEMSWTAYRHPTLGFTAQIDRFPA